VHREAGGEHREVHVIDYGHASTPETLAGMRAKLGLENRRLRWVIDGELYDKHAVDRIDHAPNAAVAFTFTDVVN
jgi:hypothetical protein